MSPRALVPVLALLGACNQPPLSLSDGIRVEAEPTRMGDRVDVEANPPALAVTEAFTLTNQTTN